MPAFGREDVDKTEALASARDTLLDGRFIRYVALNCVEIWVCCERTGPEVVSCYLASLRFRHG